MKSLLCTLLTLLLLPAATFQQEPPVPEEPPYTIRVTSADGGQAVVKVLKLDVEGADARQFTRKATPFEIEIEVEDFVAEFGVVSGRAKIEFFGEENRDGVDLVLGAKLSATGTGRVRLTHHESPGGVISVVDDAEK